jgi:hypothetical protein
MLSDWLPASRPQARHAHRTPPHGLDLDAILNVLAMTRP